MRRIWQSMELKDLLPLGGVAVGWLLKELSDSIRRGAETRATLGAALLGLLDLDGELRRLGMALAFQKNRPITWEQYETIRRATARRYLTRTDPTKAVEAAVAALARVNPVQASQLRDLPTMLAMFHATSLQALSRDADTEQYVKMLSLLEVSVDVAEHALKRTVLRLARLHGPATWLRVRWSWHRRQSRLAAKNTTFGEAMLSDLYTRADGGSGPAKGTPSDDA